MQRHHLSYLRPTAVQLTKLVCALAGCLLPLFSLHAQDSPAAESTEESQPKAVTADPSLALDHLELLLVPLTKSQLLVEAEAWRDLVGETVQQISNHEIATRKKNEDIAEADAEPAISEAEEDERRDDKEEELETLVELREKQAALLERFEAVLSAYEEKGGDPTEHRQYAQAVSGIRVEITDVNATWTAVRGWLTSSEGGVKWLKEISKFVAVILFFSLIAGIGGKVVRKATSMNEGMSDLLRTFINNMTRRTILFIGVLMALSAIGVNISALLALIGGSAFIVGFALQDTLGNFAAGLMLLIYRPFDVGDSVEVAGVNGKVSKVSLVSTTIQTFDNKVVLVPNKQVWGQVITNATASSERRVDMVFGIGYDDDTDQAKEILNRIVSEHELVLSDPKPVIKVNELADSSVNFVCRPWTKTDDYWTVYWDVTEKVKKEFDSKGISIPYPQQDIHLHKTVE